MTANLYTSEQVKRLDHIAINEHGIDGYSLMKKAAMFSFHTLVKQWPACKKIHVLCGSGNNAGDGYLLASIAINRGFQVNLHYLSLPENLKNDALHAYHESQQNNVPCKPFSDKSIQALPNDGSTIIIDALLGTGLNAEVLGRYKLAIQACNISKAPILSIDIPSGLSANTGQVYGLAIKAQCTATFIGMKQGMYTGSGRNYCGNIFFDRLGITPEIYQKVPVNANKLSLQSCLNFIKPREFNAHKGNFGHVLLIGGDHGYGGAILMAAEAAIRMGAGLVSVATQAEYITAMLTRQPEVMCHSVCSTEQLRPLIRAASVLVIGPGLGQSEWSRQMLQCALLSKKMIILDADALNLLAIHPDWLKHTNVILTPHPGEAARLLKVDNDKIQENRFVAVESIQKQYGGSLLLKGSGSLICHDDSSLKLCPYGNPGMATGGMGDVLSGIIGGLIAQGLNKEQALELATCIHAKSADIAAERSGQRGLLATDLIPIARNLLNRAL